MTHAGREQFEAGSFLLLFSACFKTTMMFHTNLRYIPVGVVSAAGAVYIMYLSLFHTTKYKRTFTYLLHYIYCTVYTVKSACCLFIEIT